MIKPVESVIIAKNGEVQLPVIRGAPPNVAVAFGPLNEASSVTTLPETIEISVFVEVDNVVCVFEAVVAVLADAEDSPEGEQPTKSGAV